MFENLKFPCKLAFSDPPAHEPFLYSLLKKKLKGKILTTWCVKTKLSIFSLHFFIVFHCICTYLYLYLHLSFVFSCPRQPSLAKSWHEVTPGPIGRPVGESSLPWGILRFLHVLYFWLLTPMFFLPLGFLFADTRTRVNKSCLFLAFFFTIVTIFIFIFVQWIKLEYLHRCKVLEILQKWLSR